MNREEKKAWALAYLAMLSYSVPVGFAFMAVKTGVGQGGSLQLLTFRFTSAFLGALLLQAAGRIRWDRAALPRRDLAITALSYVGFLGFQAFGLLYTTSIVSGILFAAVPVFARLIGGVVLKERSTRTQNLFAALSVGAVMAMFAIGLNTDIVKLVRSGGKPIFMGFCCWVGIAVVSLVMQHMLGIW